MIYYEIGIIDPRATNYQSNEGVKKMEISKKIEMVKSWGFKQVSAKQFMRPAPKGFTEWWSIEKPDFFDFVEEGVGFSHDYWIKWSIFENK